MKNKIKKSLTSPLFYFCTLSLPGCNATGSSSVLEQEYIIPLDSKAANLSSGNKANISSDFSYTAHVNMLNQVAVLKQAAQKVMADYFPTNPLHNTQGIYTDDIARKNAYNAALTLIADYDNTYNYITAYYTAYTDSKDMNRKKHNYKQSIDPNIPYSSADIYHAARYIATEPNYKRIPYLNYKRMSYPPVSNDFWPHLDTNTHLAVVCEMLIIAHVAHHIVRAIVYCDSQYHNTIPKTQQMAIQAINNALTLRIISQNDADNMINKVIYY